MKDIFHIYIPLHPDIEGLSEIIKQAKRIIYDYHGVPNIKIRYYEWLDGNYQLHTSNEIIRYDILGQFMTEENGMNAINKINQKLLKCIGGQKHEMA